MMNTEEDLEPATVTLIVYRGIGLQPPKGKKKDSKKAKWKILFCHGQEKKMSTMEVVDPNGNPVWDTTTTIPVGNSYEPLVLMLHYRDSPVGQVIIPWTQVPDKSVGGGPQATERFGELEGVKKNPDPPGGVYFSCWIDSYRPAQLHPRKPLGLLKRLSLSRSKLSASSASIAGNCSEPQPPESRKAAAPPTVKKLKRRLFHRGGGDKAAAAPASQAAAPDRVSKAVSMGNLSASPLSMAGVAQLDAAAAASPAPSSTASPAPSSGLLQRHPFARPQSLHNLALDDEGAASADAVAMATTDGGYQQQHQLQHQLSRSRSAACLFYGPTYPSVDTDRPLPEVTDFRPDRASALGGQRVVVRGVALAVSAADLIGASLAGVPCRAVAFISPEEVLLTAGTAPLAGTAGPVELVTVSAGCVRSEGTFTYSESGGGGSRANLLAPGGVVARSPSLCQLPLGGGVASSGQPEIRHAKSNSLEGPPQPLQAQSALALTPKPAQSAAAAGAAKSQHSGGGTGGNIKKSRSVWDLRLGRRGSDASNGSQQNQQQQQQQQQSKLRKRDSGKGTLSKKQLVQEAEQLRAQLEAARDERAQLTLALMEAERLALEAEQRALEAEARARMQSDAHDDRMLELTNFIDGLQARIIESGHVELLEKAPARPPRC